MSKKDKATIKRKDYESSCDNNKYITTVSIVGKTNFNYNIHHFILILKGLLKYQPKHLCDFGTGIIHENPIGKQIGEIISQEVDNSFYIANVFLKDGYVSLILVDDTLTLDLKTLNKNPDVDLILDHLTAPISNSEESGDGFGMYDYSYSITKHFHGGINKERYSAKTETDMTLDNVFDDKGVLMYSVNKKNTIKNT